MAARTTVALAGTVLVALLCAAATLAAGTHHSRWDTMSLAQRAKAQRALVVYDWRVVTTLQAARWPRQMPAPGYPYSAALQLRQHTIMWHTARMRWVQRELRETLRALAQQRRLVPGGAGHWVLWWCIHTGTINGRVVGRYHEGTGYNGQYTGPLQMSHHWAGYPIYDWNTVPLPQVFAAAEAQYKANHYSRAWLYGQWPQTGPQCASVA